MRIRFEQMHYRMEDKVAPASGTLEQLFEQVEAGEWKNMSLVQFMSRDDQDAEPLAAVIDRSGVVKIKKGHGESAPPKSPEELRQKIKLMGHCYLMTQITSWESMCWGSKPRMPRVKSLPPLTWIWC